MSEYCQNCKVTSDELEAANQKIADLSQEIEDNTYTCERCESLRYGIPAHSTDEMEHTCHACLKELRDEEGMGELGGVS